MSKRKYYITVRTSFEDTLEVEAESVAEAEELAMEEFNEYAIQELEPETECIYVSIGGNE